MTAQVNVFAATGSLNADDEKKGGCDWKTGL
jgi:hypothetical protein